ncbi:MAG: DNA-protecting protein DprA [Thermotoga sp.]|nr:MAG: DNA-protecting protein DprA [Thermotoga sp.]
MDFEDVLKEISPLAIENVKSHLRNQRLRFEESNIHTITFWDDCYPELLKEISDPPPVLFCLGDRSVLKGRKFAIVGTRKSTPYGEKIAYKFAKELSREFVIVSGMAFGIDAKAHLGAMETGKTIAVLASGVDIPSPRGNRSLYNKISKNGCVLSVYPLGEGATRYRFPERNSLIAGLSSGVLVVQAPMKSGALITANWALDFGRDVFAIPGDIGKYSNEGTNWLIKNGAIPVTSPSDIAIYYGLGVSESTNVESEVLELIRGGVDTVDDLLEITGKSIGEILSEISRLEMMGIISNDAGHLRLL